MVHEYIIYRFAYSKHKKKIELTVIYVPRVCSSMPVQAKFQICAIFVPDILETCQFRPKKVTLNRII
ncbi:hypothetical protein Hanom_Chr11g00979771 [Helianthus anomalus]